MKNDFEVLKWDTEFFGFKVARVSAYTTYESLVQDLKEKSIKLAYYDSEEEKSDLPKYICQKRVYSKSVEMVDDPAFEDENQETRGLGRKNSKDDLTNESFESAKVLRGKRVVSYAKSSEWKPLRELAISAGHASRYLIDKKIESKRFEELYEIWLKRSINREIADEIFVYNDGDDILGFVTAKLSENAVTIGLIAVADKAQGKGIGTLLLSAVNNYALKQKKETVFVSTQAENRAGCQLYEKNGFIILKESYTYHIWV